MNRKIREAFAAVGAAVPEILLPAAEIPLETFAVNACDQYSAQPEYWNAVERQVGGRASAFHMILPEARLPQTGEKVRAIHTAMERYLREKAIVPIGEGLIYLRRQTTTGIRSGLMLALDLEQYDYREGSRSLIRATEKTVVERLPARIEIRRGALLELPHIMVLLDDRQNRLMKLLRTFAPELPVIYDFDLMMDGGRLTGYHITQEKMLLAVADALLHLKEESSDGMLYAMGDGNHSFAAAKAYWEELKPTLDAAERESHPARYALVELVNLYDEGLSFEPIHRLLLHVDPDAVQREVGFDAMNPPPLQELQPRLDAWLACHPEAELEYIHGEDECCALAAAAPDRIAVTWEEFSRDTLFADVERQGALCRKSFSMGAAQDKRYYLECRRLKE